MSLFVADLINQIRQQFGTQKTIITPKSLEYANKIVAGYNEENWDAFGEHMTDGKSHDDNLIDKVDNNMHTSGLENLGGSLQVWTWDDDGNLYKLPIEKQTMDSMKNSIYETILAMMFDDAYSGWGHAQTFIGYGVYNLGKTSVGVDFVILTIREHLLGIFILSLLCAINSHLMSNSRYFKKYFEKYFK
ncbi:SEC10/PgrA surface exclusion domain-containing protein [Ligilactobacillus salivarius]|uniref:SCP domain-containing protein n=1 Tax=Ligilactobacillus salivarius DSM 20555 = ATCC 11741 TaxID=1423799 RepID=C2EFC2_9LACO|nr:SEC10/PgrA surface exclusion domain-containing protein [Ligilactobacillus salivarius]EEJ74675.1 hypothetical protein HMPREF0545_0344 [Ligilactobacillus salivarius DSM 20555 = ATCC 11741]KRM70855.1 hypothetical protein FC55_GL000078 [Ligilactobacillus salivarius DSM 20555 = ATCC 11741]MDG9755344.1 SEC10/PgrA surface exclusion domain-containing protein [Ligilactobacillus salivarius]MDQ4441854.1 SEC10/PgrA surface exclusion domain-containing protein [Ligilactobacillus salivarius]MDV9167614.1 S